MKEATGEVSGTVITIIIVALLAGIGTWLFAGENSIGRQWIKNTFEKQTGITDTNTGNAVKPQ